MVVDFTISSQDACVQGHFPGAPLVPGAYLLCRIDDMLREYWPDYQLVGFGKVKFLAPLMPDQRASLHIELISDEKAQVRISYADTVLLSASAILRKG